MTWFPSSDYYTIIQHYTLASLPHKTETWQFISNVEMTNVNLLVVVFRRFARKMFGNKVIVWNVTSSRAVKAER